MAKPASPSAPLAFSLIDRVPALVETLNQTGFATIEGVITEQWIEAARAEVRSLMSVHGEKFFSVVNPADQSGSAAAVLAKNPEMASFCKALTASAYPRGLEDGDLYNVLRIITGRAIDKSSLKMHYDSSVVTILIPILIPEYRHGKSGELILFPNMRPYRSLSIINIIEKVFMQNAIARRIFLSKLNRDYLDNIRVLKPGNIYLFWGYRSYHGNLACEAHSVRATMLLHYGNPHSGSLMTAAVRKLRALIENRRRDSL